MVPGLLRVAGPPHAVPHVDPPEALDSCFSVVVPHSARLLSLYDQATFSEGPAWWPARQSLVWSDIEGRRVLGWHEDGRVEVVVDATPFINGHTIDCEGNLVHCEHGNRRLSRTTPDGRYEPLVERYRGRRFNSPNDVVCAADGALWFSDPSFGLKMPKQGLLAESEIDHCSVYRVDPVTFEATRMADLEQPNGLAFTPDGQTLYVTDTSRSLGGDRHTIFAFDVTGTWELKNRRVFAQIDPGIPDGLRVDSRGWVWTSSEAGVQVLSSTGLPLGLIPTPQACSNLCFSPDEARLFITSQANLYAIDLNADHSTMRPP
ncbi:SMP-30/gluconolactonase/LRE family protein [Methylobacterium sp. Leaf117]|uniref:SMP-30/gluconolactonase/LRE family protein n=1 Tax=Methylobacterium sp. Leaf117 TaxID=1736260 RepID=UPI0007008126|nr:SMP-30/gluconolactonase/LRE family protein [Methylobacterium sp. Leaf117]KQP80268.1 gluconolactonase [Methylobacterium sp. Leaf117]